MKKITPMPPQYLTVVIKLIATVNLVKQNVRETVNLNRAVVEINKDRISGINR